MGTKARKADLRDYLAGLDSATERRKRAKAVYDEAEAEYTEAFRPTRLKIEDRVIRGFLEACPEDSGYPRSHILVCLALLYYSPEALYGGKVPLRLAKSIARVLDVKPPSVYTARKKVASWLRVYPDFFGIIYKLYDTFTDNPPKRGR